MTNILFESKELKEHYYDICFRDLYIYMVVFVNTKNNADALRAINTAKTTLKNNGYRNEKEKNSII